MNQLTFLLTCNPYPTPPCKACTHCGRVKPRTEFYKGKNGKPTPTCKVCAKALYKKEQQS